MVAHSLNLGECHASDSNQKLKDADVHDSAHSDPDVDDDDVDVPDDDIPRRGWFDFESAFRRSCSDPQLHAVCNIFMYESVPF